MAPLPIDQRNGVLTRSASIAAATIVLFGGLLSMGWVARATLAPPVVDTVQLERLSDRIEKLSDRVQNLTDRLSYVEGVTTGALLPEKPRVRASGVGP